MKLNTKVRYGVRAMLQIGLKNSEGGVLQKDIAEAQNIPLNYLDSIIAALKSEGLIVNVSGRGGGYVLRKPSESISVYDIYRAFEPELCLVNCVCDTNACKRVDFCPVNGFWFDLSMKVISEMKDKNLSQLIEEQLLLLT